MILPVHNNPAISGRHTKPDQIDVTIISKWLNLCDELRRPCKRAGNRTVGNLILDMRIIDCTSKELGLSTKRLQTMPLSVMSGRSAFRDSGLSPCFMPKNCGRFNLASAEVGYAISMS